MLVSEEVQKGEYDDNKAVTAEETSSVPPVVDPESGPKSVRWIRRVFGNGETTELHKSLETRMLILNALGSVLGTGLYFSIGGTIAQAGPGFALIIYAITGVFVTAVVMCLSEMTSYIPVTGAFQHFGARFVDDSLGLALGINYCLSWLVSIPSEATSVMFIIDFWVKESGLSVPNWVWAMVIVFPLFCLQLFNVRVYGEVEYWLSWVKVFFIGMFVIIGLLYNWGGVPTASVPSPGLNNFRHGAAFAGGFTGMFSQGYAFYTMGGTESVAVTAGETKLPWRAVPQASRGSIARVILICVMVVLVIGLNVWYKDPRLVNAMNTSDVTVSPVTIIFEMAGFSQAKNVINAVLLVSILSSLNSCFYIASRMLHSLAKDRMFFPIFAWTTRSGVPLVAEVFTLGFACLTFLTTIWGNGVVFQWFTNITSASSILTWMLIGVISYRFHRALKVQNIPKSDLPLHQWMFPLLPILCVTIGPFLLAGMVYSSCQGKYGVDWTWRNPFGTLLGVGVFIISYVFWKTWHWKTDKIKRAHEIDLASYRVWGVGEGKEIMESYERNLFDKLTENRTKSFKGKVAYALYWLNNPLEGRRQLLRRRNANALELGVKSTDSESEDQKSLEEEPVDAEKTYVGVKVVNVQD